MKELLNLVREKKIEGIRDIRDESNREGIRVSIDLRTVLNQKLLKDNFIKIHK